MRSVSNSGRRVADANSLAIQGKKVVGAKVVDSRRSGKAVS